MAQNTKNQRLAQVKRALAEKYESLARSCNSRPRRKTLLRHARSYRDQVADLVRRSG